MTSLEIRFLPGRHRTAPLAVRLAQEIAPSSSLAEPPRDDLAPGEVSARTSVPGPALSRLSALWALVAPWPGSRLTLDDELLSAPGWRLAEWLRCLARAGAFVPPARYCQSGIVPPGIPLPWLPCRLWAASWPLWAGRIDWRDPPRARDQCKAALADLGLLHCPFLEMAPFDRLLFPAERLLDDVFPRAGEE